MSSAEPEPSQGEKRYGVLYDYNSSPHVSILRNIVRVDDELIASVAECTGVDFETAKLSIEQEVAE